MPAPASQTETQPTRPHFFTRLIATGLFTGYSRWAPGTVGTLLAVLIYLIPGVSSPPVLLTLTVIGFFAGVITSGRVARAEGGTLTASAARLKQAFQPGSEHGPDPSIVVIDEMVGMWVSLLWVPKTIVAVVFCFLLFRLLDILKPEPARTLERLPGGWGIMGDDVVAGAYTNLAFHLLLLLAGLAFPETSSIIEQLP
ncbi:MAG: phosphatidylglycerophosphatase A [Bacteroidota bacterium]